MERILLVVSTKTDPKICGELDDRTLSLFSIGCLSGLDHEKIEKHLESCSKCLERLAGLHDQDELIDLVRECGLGSPAIVANSSSPGELIRADFPHPRIRASRVVVPLATTDRYELRCKIGSGGMGEVWSAHDRMLDREVALKILSSGPDSNERLTRFERESRIVARLQHPGIPPVYELGRLPDGRHFLAMKRVFGRTLRDHLEGNTSVALDSHLDVFLQMCRTVAFAHSNGIIHRDLKPANIMIGEFGEVQVMDWGISEDLNGPRSDKRRLLGTPAYMAPEQALGLRCGRRTDVYALGLILSDLMTGGSRDTELVTTKLLDTVANGAQTELSGRMRKIGVDEQLVAIAQRCVSYEPTRRPRDAGVLAEQITGYLSERQAHLRRTELEHFQHHAVLRERSKRRRLRVGTACLALIIVALTALGYSKDQERKHRARALINDSILESRTIWNGINRSNHLQEQQIGHAISVASNALAMSRQADEPLCADDAAKLLGQLRSEQAKVERVQKLLAHLDDGLRIESRRTSHQRYEERVSRRKNLVHAGRATSFVFLNRGTFDQTDRVWRRTQARRPPPDAAMLYVNRIFRDVFRYSEERRSHYKAAYTEFGIDLRTGPESIAHSVIDVKPSVQAKVVSGLRLWFLFSADLEHPDASVLADALHLIDQCLGTRNESLVWRDSVRSAMVTRDVSAIESCCAEGRGMMADQPEELLWGLGCYESLFFPENRLQFLRISQRYHLSSYLLNNELAVQLEKSIAPGGSLSYVSTAVAAIPSWNLQLSLARKLLQIGHVDEFYALRDQCLEKHADQPSIFLWWADAMAMSALIPKSEAIDTYQTILDKDFEYPQFPLARIGQLHYEQGDLELALTYLEKARAVSGLSEDDVEELRKAIDRVRSEL